jgi:hypothetical protein
MFYEVVAKVTEFDQTSSLKAEYEFKDDEWLWLFVFFDLEIYADLWLWVIGDRTGVFLRDILINLGLMAAFEGF